MDKKKKVISGLFEIEEGRKNIFSNEQKHQIIEDFLSLGCSKQEIWEKYTGRRKEHGEILRWMRQLGYSSPEVQIKRINVCSIMQDKDLKDKDFETLGFENTQLKKRILELEVRLKREEMKAIAYSTMVDIAEKELNISIKKKFNTKP